MQGWLPRLDRQLEIAQQGAHADFRCFLSAEPPSLSSMKNMPESLMQSCLKVANEAPSDIKSNLKRAWAPFSQSRIDSVSKPVEFQTCLFTMCWFHAIVVGRHRFGQKGWSRKYSFNMGDLTICADVLENYLSKSSGAMDNAVPWSDLRYIFGEIMYGGHITDFWDRRTNNTYLKVLFTESIFRGGELGPKFCLPLVGDAEKKMTQEDYLDYIDTTLPVETPALFGLHANAEISILTNNTTSLFRTILLVEGAGASAGSDEGSEGGGTSLADRVEDLMQKLPEEFDMPTIQESAKQLLSGPTGPFVVVALQECTRMNKLLNEVRRSLLELQKGLAGQLNMSPAMDDLGTSQSLVAKWHRHKQLIICSTLLSCSGGAAAE
eukprot:scaffold1741_cov262-Pinguiococcus_pyrenoidosus.AAC.4